MTDADIKNLLSRTKRILDQVGYINNLPSKPDLPEAPEFYKLGEPIVTNASQLTDPAVLSRFVDLTKYIIQVNSSQEALTLQHLIEDCLEIDGQIFKENQSDLFSQYNNIIAVLKFMNLDLVSGQRRRDLIDRYILVAVQWGVNVQEKFQVVLTIENDFLFGGRVAQELAEALMGSSVKLGNITILTPDNRQVAATVGSWIKEYIRYGQSTAEHKTGALQRTEFLRKSKDVQKLTPAEREILLKIFKLYDWLMYGGDDGESRLDLLIGPDEEEGAELPVPIPSGVPNTTAPLPTSPFSNSAKASSDLRKGEEKIPNRQTQRPSQGKIISQIIPPRQVPKFEPPKVVPVPPKFSAPLPKPTVNPVRSPMPEGMGGRLERPTSNGVNVQDLIKRTEEQSSNTGRYDNDRKRLDDVSRGVSLSQQGKNTLDLDKMKKDIEAKKLQAQLDITRKLEALKRRKSL